MFKNLKLFLNIDTIWKVHDSSVLNLDYLFGVYFIFICTYVNISDFCCIIYRYWNYALSFNKLYTNNNR